MLLTRREAMVALLAAGVGGGASVLVENSRVDDEHRQVVRLRRGEEDLQARVRRLSYNTASGGGVNLKMMPDPETGDQKVPLEEVFSFDRNHAMCRVDTNPHPFTMKTFAAGEILVPANGFFMAMVATVIDQFAVSSHPEGTRRVTMRGGLSCRTQVGLATVTIGSRSGAEHATYLIEAVDGGPEDENGTNPRDSFAFTVFFDGKEAPVNQSVFGPRFTFTGKMIEGKITVVDPAA